MAQRSASHQFIGPAQAHHEQQRLILRVSEGLVAELDVVPHRSEELLGDSDPARARVMEGLVHATSQQDR